MRQKQVEVNGKTFTLQAVPFKFYMDLIDKHTDKNGNLKKSSYIEDLFKYCVVDPKIKMGNFDNDFSTGLKLSSEIESFLTGDDEPETVPEESTE